MPCKDVEINNNDTLIIKFYHDKIKEAMMMIHNACIQECFRCPFKQYCSILAQNNMPIPNSENFVKEYA